ncbi:MAG: transcription termination factor NusA [Alphaproteobacteria bacterium]|nr:transcription termination factor NusA [Alphaproteobacteria bacterium]
MAVLKNEVLLVVETVAQEKNIDREHVFEALELAIQKAGRNKYGLGLDIRAFIDRRNGEITMQRFREIVDELEDTQTQILLSDARKIDKTLEAGNFIRDSLPPIDFGRIGVQSAKQIIVQKVRDAERNKQYEEFIGKVGEITSRIVKRVEYGNLIIDLGNGAEGLLRRNELIGREHFKRGDRILAYIYSVKRENRGPQVFLSRTHNQFMVKLFRQEVPEVYDGVVQIINCARDPGSRAKISVISNDPSIDPVGACVGMRGSRVQAVVSELQGEKIDIIPYSEDIVTYVVNTLAPAEITKVVIDENTGKLDVVVPEDQLSQAIGRRGQNVRLATQITDVDIDILTEAQDAERRELEFSQRSQLFMEQLDVDDVIARLLIAEGFHDIEEIIDSTMDELSAIKGFDEGLAGELQNRAQQSLEILREKQAAEMKKLKMQDDIMNFAGLNHDMLVILGENSICNLENFADLAADELYGEEDSLFKDLKFNAKKAAELITNARIQLGWIEPEPQSEPESENEADAETDISAGAEAIEAIESEAEAMPPEAEAEAMPPEAEAEAMPPEAEAEAMPPEAEAEANIAATDEPNTITGN